MRFKLLRAYDRYREPVIIITSILLIIFFGTLIGSRFKTVNLTIACGPSTAESYVLAQAISEQLSIYDPHLKLRVLETKGSEENLDFLTRGKVQLATVPVVSSYPPSIRLVSPLFYDFFQIVVTENSNIKSIGELKGKRIAISLGSDKANEFFLSVLKHYGIFPKDIDVQPLSTEESDAAFLSGKVDAVFRLRPPGNKRIQNLVQQGNARIIPIDQGPALNVKHPEFQPGMIPKGVYKGNTPIPEQDLPTVSVRRMLLTHSRVNPDYIYKITQLLYEQRQFLTSRIPLATQISTPDRTEGIIVPLHSGAENYYNREKPSFLEANSDVLGLAITVSLAIASWLWQLKEKFSMLQKNRSDLYSRELLNLIEKIENCSDLETLEQLRQELYREFAIVIDAFDKDQITAESLQSIRFTWEATMYALKDRESYLLRQLEKHRTPS